MRQRELGIPHAGQGEEMESEDPVEGVLGVISSVGSGLHRRALAATGAGDELGALLSALSAAGWPPSLLMALAGGVVGAALAGAALARRALAGPRFGWSQSSLSTASVAALAGLVAAGLLAVLAARPGPVRQGLLAGTLLVALALWARGFVRWSIAPPGAAPGLARFARDVAFAVAWALAGAALVAFLRRLGAGAGLRDLVAALAVATPVTILLAAAHWRSRAPIAYALAAQAGERRWLRRIAVRWPAAAVALVVVCMLAAQALVAAGRFLPIGPAAAALCLALLAPFIDMRLARWARAGLDEGRIGVGLIAARRTARLAAATLTGGLFVAVWGAPFADLAGLRMDVALRGTLEIAAVVLAGAFLWNLVGAASDRILEAEIGLKADGDEEAGAPRSRLGTVLPLTSGAVKIGVAALAALSILLILGVNVWPLVTGLSVFGLAVGFGSQTLVKDIVSGLFFLADDAFRMGEYIEVAGAKGTVEKISIRSLSLRHPRGAVATIPYGQIGKINNHSRDWVIEKLVFRVAFDTDVEQVRKIFKKIGLALMEDPELRDDLLEPFKSQGIAEMEDGTLLIRAKFKAKPGRQFAARKAVLAAVQKAFAENGVRAVARPLAPAEPGR